MKTLKNKFQLILLACLFLGYSCGKNTTTEIPIALLEIAMDDILVTEGSTVKGSTKDSELNSFYDVQIVNLKDLEGVDKILKYESKIESVTVESVSITITAITEEDDTEKGTVVKEFVFNAKDVGNLDIPLYNLGTTYTDDNMKSFAVKILTKLFFNGNITLTSSGKTDIPFGKKLKIKIRFENITVTANVLK